MNDYEKLTDDEIIRKVRSNDRELYTVIMDRYQGRLLRYAENLIRNRHKAIDVIQNSFIKAFINLNSFDIKKNFSSWIYRIVHNEAINMIRKNNMEVMFPEDLDVQSEEDIEQNFEKAEIVSMVHKCLANTPILYAGPLSLYYIEDKSYEEISDILRIPINTVATRIRRAKKIMRKICQKK